MASVGVWAGISYGIVLVLTWSKIATPLRKLSLFRCQLCTGFWVGLGLSLAGLGPASVMAWPLWAQALGDAFMTGTWCFVAHAIVMMKLGGRELDLSH